MPGRVRLFRSCARPMLGQFRLFCGGDRPHCVGGVDHLGVELDQSGVTDFRARPIFRLVRRFGVGCDQRSGSFYHFWVGSTNAGRARQSNGWVRPKHGGSKWAIRVLAQHNDCVAEPALPTCCHLTGIVRSPGPLSTKRPSRAQRCGRSERGTWKRYPKGTFEVSFFLFARSATTAGRTLHWSPKHNRHDVGNAPRIGHIQIKDTHTQ